MPRTQFLIHVINQYSNRSESARFITYSYYLEFLKCTIQKHNRQSHHIDLCATFSVSLDKEKRRRISKKVITGLVHFARCDMKIDRYVYDK